MTADSLKGTTTSSSRQSKVISREDAEHMLMNTDAEELLHSIDRSRQERVQEKRAGRHPTAIEVKTRGSRRLLLRYSLGPTVRRQRRCILHPVVIGVEHGGIWIMESFMARNSVSHRFCGKQRVDCQTNRSNLMVGCCASSRSTEPGTQDGVRLDECCLIWGRRKLHLQCSLQLHRHWRRDDHDCDSRRRHSVGMRTRACACH